MRKLIAGMKVSLDEKTVGPEGYADWVDAWAEEYGLTPQVDATLLGGAMYPGYERYWSAIQDAPDKPLPMTGKYPTPAEIEWGEFAARTPHYVLSSALTSANWPLTRFLRRTEDVAALKKEAGKDIYLMGGTKITAGLIDAGLVDELRLIVYPLIAGAGTSLFATVERRRALELHAVEQLDGGRVRLTYGIA